MINTPVSDNAYAAASRARKGAIASEFYGQFSQLAKGRGGLPLLRTMFDTLKQLLGEYEHDFIAQLLFPEHYPPARYPMHFPIPTVVFETVDYGFIRPNNSGNLSIVVYPKRLGAWPSWSESFDVTGLMVPTASDFVHSGDGAVVATGYATHLARPVSPCVEIYNDENWSPDRWGKWHGLFAPDDIRLLYQSLRMTGACFRMQYMSRLDEVSGYMCSALDYKHAAASGNTITQIDYGLYKRTTHPLEGVRMVWFPKDIMDEEFEDYAAWVSHQGDFENWGTKARPLTMMEYPFHTAVGGPVSVANAENSGTVEGMKEIFNVSDSVYRLGSLVKSGSNGSTQSLSHSGKTEDGASRMDTDCMMMYATGLPHDNGGANQFRVELIRHWEAIPLQKFRQYLYGERPFTSQKGYDAMKSMGNMFPFFGNVTSNEANGLKDVVQGRLGELDAGQINAAIASGGSNDILTNVAQALG
jgi:hypothetical protein